jgi:hypothetical protein
MMCWSMHLYSMHLYSMHLYSMHFYSMRLYLWRRCITRSGGAGQGGPIHVLHSTALVPLRKYLCRAYSTVP